MLNLQLGKTTTCEYALPGPFYVGDIQYGKNDMRKRRPRRQTGKVQPVRNMLMQW